MIEATSSHAKETQRPPKAHPTACHPLSTPEKTRSLETDGFGPAILTTQWKRDANENLRIISPRDLRSQAGTSSTETAHNDGSCMKRVGPCGNTSGGKGANWYSVTKRDNQGRAILRNTRHNVRSF